MNDHSSNDNDNNGGGGGGSAKGDDNKDARATVPKTKAMMTVLMNQDHRIVSSEKVFITASKNQQQ